MRNIFKTITGLFKGDSTPQVSAAPQAPQGSQRPAPPSHQPPAPPTGAQARQRPAPPSHQPPAPPTGAQARQTTAASTGAQAQQTTTASSGTQTQQPTAAASGAQARQRPAPPSHQPPAPPTGAQGQQTTTTASSGAQAQQTTAAASGTQGRQRPAPPSHQPPAPPTGAQGQQTTTASSGAQGQQTTTASSGAQDQQPPRDRLLPEEKQKLAKRKNSFFQGFLTKVGGMTLTEADKDAGAPDEIGAKDIAKMGWGVVDMLGALATESMGIAGNEKYGKKIWDIAMKNGDAASILPMADAIQSSIRALVNGGRTIKHIVDYIKTKGRKDFAEFRNIVKEGIGELINLGQAVNGYLGIFQSMAKKVPIIGAILGTVSAALSFAQNLHIIIKSTKNKDRMRAQKEKAKERIKANQGSTSYVEMRHSRIDLFKVGKESLHFNPSAIAQQQGTTRKTRLDELTTTMRTPPQPAGQQSAGQQGGAQQAPTEDPLADALEDYDIVKELTGANKKRQRQGILDIVFGDAVAFGTALAALDPTVGALVGNSINLAVGVGTSVKEVTTFLRWIGRNYGWGICDENKSDANKLKRRHTLAVNLFQRLQGLSREKITEVNPETNQEEEVAKVRQGLEKYRLMSQQVDALGVGYGPLMRAQTTREVLDTIRGGFYREGEG